MREDHFLDWRDCAAGGPATSFLPAPLAIFADQDGVPAATAIRVDHGEGWLAWLGWGVAQLASIMLLKCFSSQAFKGLRAECTGMSLKTAWFKIGSGW